MVSLSTLPFWGGLGWGISSCFLLLLYADEPEKPSKILFWVVSLFYFVKMPRQFRKKLYLCALI